MEVSLLREIGDLGTPLDAGSGGVPLCYVCLSMDEKNPGSMTARMRFTAADAKRLGMTKMPDGKTQITLFRWKNENIEHIVCSTNVSEARIHMMKVLQEHINLILGTEPEIQTKEVDLRSDGADQPDPEC